MAFILSADGRNENVVSAFHRYRDYLRSVKDRFPPSAYTLAVSDWYFDFSNHRCPHDAWLEKLELSEMSSGEQSDARSLSLSIRLLGAHHDGYIELRYPKVHSYWLDHRGGGRAHRDWRYDELRVSETGNLIHEVEWCGAGDTAVWLIEASDLEYIWVSKGHD